MFSGMAWWRSALVFREPHPIIVNKTQRIRALLGILRNKVESFTILWPINVTRKGISISFCTYAHMYRMYISCQSKSSSGPSPFLNDRQYYLPFHPTPTIYHEVVSRPACTLPILNVLLGLMLAAVTFMFPNVSIPPFTGNPTRFTCPLPTSPSDSMPKPNRTSFVPTTSSSSIRSIKPTMPACTVLRFGLLMSFGLKLIDSPNSWYDQPSGNKMSPWAFRMSDIWKAALRSNLIVFSRGSSAP